MLQTKLRKEVSLENDTLDILKIHRIDHGNNSLKDESLIKEIIKRNIALTVCPLSNTALQVVDNLQNHPLKKMMDLGLFDEKLYKKFSFSVVMDSKKDIPKGSIK